ncbi:hypothetical protein ACFLTY_00225 [Chloroflexota bacterium]
MMNSETLSYAEAVSYLGFCSGLRPERYIENYVASGELSRVSRRRLVSKVSLDALSSQRNYALITDFTHDDYRRCLEFAISSFYHYRSHADLLVGGRQRGVGEWAEDFVPGKLAEIGFSKFVGQKFGVELVLDFSLRPQAVVGQDVTEVVRKVRGRSIANPPKQRISVKQTQTKGVWLVVTPTEVTDPQRVSDVYVLVRVDLTPNHLIRYFRSHPELEAVREHIPEALHIEAWIVGFAYKDELQRMEAIPEIRANAPRYALRAGQLHKSPDEWEQLVSSL